MNSKKNHLEFLANELLHDIFDYLSSIDLIKHFQKLNQRFSYLISQRLLKLDFSHLTKSQYENFIQILPFHQINSLKISNKWTINIFSRISFQSMINLRVLTLSHINYNDLKSFFERNLAVFQQLNIFKLQSTNLNGLDCERIFVLKKLFSQMPKLRLCQIPLIDVNDFDDLIPTFTLEQLTIDYCTMSSLGRLLDYIPSVQSLTIRIYTDLQNSAIKNSHWKNVSIRSLQISIINTIPFNQIEDLFRRSLNHLEKLKFSFQTDASSQSCYDYVDQKRWELLLQSLGSLKDFHCCIQIPIQSEIISNSYEENEFSLRGNWKMFSQVYTYSYNTILRIHTALYPKRRLDIIPSKVFVIKNNIYFRVRDLHLLIDPILITNHNNISGILYPNVASLTLIANKSFNEQLFLIYLYSIIDRKNLLYLTIQLDTCTNSFLLNLIENSSKLYSLTISTHQSWLKLIKLSSQISKCSIRSLIIYETFSYFDQYNSVHQLFDQLEIVSVTVTSIENCYRLLTLLFIGSQRKTVEKLRSLTIKCDFDEPDAIAHWVRSNIIRKLSYKCTTSVLTIWL